MTITNCRILTIIIAFSAIACPVSATTISTDNVTIETSSRIGGAPNTQSNDWGQNTGRFMDQNIVLKFPAKKSGMDTAIMLAHHIPPGMSLFVGDLDGEGSGPVAIGPNDIGAYIYFGGLNNMQDGIEFSDNGGKSFDYVPVQDLEGFNKNVTDIRIKPSAMLNFGIAQQNNITLRYKMRVD